MGKKKSSIHIDFSNAGSANGVTGSCYYFEMENTKFLLECGLVQSNNILSDYRANNQKFNFKVKDIDYVFLMDRHADHSLRTPLLYKRGCQATIIVPKGATRIFKDMLLDCAKINQKDADYLSRCYGRTIEPLYTEEDVHKTMAHVIEYNINERIQLNDELAFNFLRSGHVITAASIELWLKSNNNVKKIYYSSDLGNDAVSKYYVEPKQKCEKANIAIVETTYSDSSRHSITVKDRKKDIEKIEQVIRQTCNIQKGKVLIPCFALDRSVEMLTTIYDIFKDDESFNIPILLDSPLMLKHIKSYFNILTGDKLLKLEEVMKWKNIVQIEEWTETQNWAESSRPCVIISSSGYLQAGRSLVYLPYILKDCNSHIMFCGYCSEGSLAWQIKTGDKRKYIKVGEQYVSNKCSITSLNSFSSHIQYKEMLDYYSSIDYENILLVHGNMSSKLTFAEELRRELSKKNRTSKVTVVNSGMKISI